MSIEIRAAVPGNAGIIAGLAIALTNEIIERTGMRHFDLDGAGLEATCRRLMTQDAYAALLAMEGTRVVGYAGMSVSHALYAGGTLTRTHLKSRLTP